MIRTKSKILALTTGLLAMQGCQGRINIARALGFIR
jgi:hypothetical protein